jgi:hypothetical protein
MASFHRWPFHWTNPYTLLRLDAAYRNFGARQVDRGLELLINSFALARAYSHNERLWNTTQTN